MSATPLLQLRDLRVAYGAIEAVKGISLELAHGELVSLIGANGAGKTTTLNAIAGILPTAGGELLYEGKGIEAGKKSLAIAVTLQPRDKTLTDSEIDAVAAKIVAEVAKTTGGVLRG